jgi:hypothetical protein
MEKWVMVLIHSVLPIESTCIWSINMYIMFPVNPCSNFSITQNKNKDRQTDILFRFVQSTSIIHIYNLSMWFSKNIVNNIKSVCSQVYKMVQSRDEHNYRSVTLWAKHIWAVSRQNQHNWFATSMDPDQPAHPRSLIRIHAVPLQTL